MRPGCDAPVAGSVLDLRDFSNSHAVLVDAVDARNRAMTGSWMAVAAAFALVALNGFFVATEFALVKVRPTRLDELARRGFAGAGRARKLVERLDESLSATQLGITLASLGLGWIGEPAFAELIEPAAARLGLSAPTREALAAALAFAIITFLRSEER